MNSRKLSFILLAWFFIFGLASHRTIVAQSTLVSLFTYYGITF